MNIAKLFDLYSRRARLTPALFTLVAPLASIALWVPNIYQVVTGLSSLLIACGTLFFLASVARYRGRKLQERLYEKWGGMPSTQMLRFRDNNLDNVTKERYRAFINDFVPNIEMPSIEDEQGNPSEADQRYESASKWLLEQTRDTNKFDLLFKENVEYGFRRNLRGLKPIGVLFALLSVVGSLSGFLLLFWESGNWFIMTGSVAATISVVSLMCWSGLVTDEWVHDAAKSYAIRLLSSCDRLEGERE